MALQANGGVETLEMGGFNIFDEDVFKKSGSFLGAGSPQELIAQSYFIDQCKAATKDNGVTFSDTGIAHLFDLLVELGLTVKEMILELPSIVMSWKESSASDILKVLEINTADMTDEEQLSIAIKALNGDNSLFFGESYDLEGAYLILYNKT